IRVSSIDAPELGQKWGRPARNFAGELVLGKEVAVHQVDVDQYGRVVACLIFPDGTDFARAMVSRAATHSTTCATALIWVIEILAKAKADHRAFRVSAEVSGRRNSGRLSA